MKIIGKLKTTNKKWIYLGLAIVVLAVAGVIVGVTMDGRCEHHREGDDKKISQVNQAYYDILTLENTTNLKITADEAKALIPLIQKDTTTATKTVQTDLIKNIYKQLSSDQYYYLLNAGNSNVKEQGFKEGGKHMEQRQGRGEEGKNNSNAMQASMKDVVLKMLTDISSK